MTLLLNSRVLPSWPMENPSAGPPPVDFSCLKRVLDTDSHGQQDIVDFYLRVTAGQLQKMQNAVRSQSGLALKDLAHSCIGSSQLLGMTAIVAPLQSLQRVAGEGQWVQAAEELAQASDALERMKTFITLNEDELKRA